jgi:hypothetical protein
MQNSIDETRPGGWTPYSCNVSADARKSFDAALEGIVGVAYHPIAVASQLVAGMNYGFFCNAKVVVPNAENFAAVVYIYQPLPGKGKPRIVNIERVSDYDYAKSSM